MLPGGERKTRSGGEVPDNFTNNPVATPAASTISVDERFAKEKISQIETFLNNEYEGQIKVLGKMGLVSSQEAELARGRQPSAEYLQKASILERLEILAKSKAISGAVFIEAVQYLAQVKELMPDLHKLAGYSLELEKMALNGKIDKLEIEIILKECSQGQGQKMADAVGRYKNWLLEEIHQGTTGGIFSAEETDNFQRFFSSPHLTVLGMPRERTPESEMAWGVVEPILRRLETWLVLKELSQVGVVNEQRLNECVECIREGKSFPQEIINSIEGLERFRYARYKGVIKNQDYDKAIAGLVHLSRDCLSNVEVGMPSNMEQEMATEESEGVMPQVESEDPLTMQKRMLNILINAWEEMLGVPLKNHFLPIMRLADINKLRALHQFLVGLNREYLNDKRIQGDKKEEYAHKIKSHIQPELVNAG